MITIFTCMHGQMWYRDVMAGCSQHFMTGLCANDPDFTCSAPPRKRLNPYFHHLAINLLVRNHTYVQLNYTK